MSKKLARIVSLFLVFLLLFVVVTGCGKSSKDTTGDDVSNGDDNEDVGTGDDQEEPEEVYDFGGRTIRRAAWWDTEPQPGTSEGADKEIARRDDLMEKYNFSVEYLNIPWDQYLETFTASTLAGEPFADWADAGSYWFYPGLVANGFLTAVDDLGVFDFSEEKWDRTTLEYGTYEGKMYALNTGWFFPRSGMFWNKNIFEREGLPNLYEIVDNKEWTWDKMLEIAKKATKDTDGDGIIDQWGLHDMDLHWQLVATNGAETIKTVDGKGVFGLSDPNAIEALQFCQDLYQVHKVVETPPEGAEWDYAGRQFIEGKSAMLAYQWWWVDNMSDGMEDDYGWIPFPMGPKTDQYISVATETNVAVIPATVNKPEEIAIFYDKMTDPYPDEDPEDWREYPEDKLRDDESVQMYKNFHDWNISKMDNWRSFQELEEMSWGFMWQIRSGNKTAQVAIDEIAAQAQAILDDAFSK